MPTPPKGPTSKSTASAPSDKKSKKVGGVTLEVDLKVESPKIREMEKVLGVSYPTVKNRVAALRVALGLDDAATDPDLPPGRCWSGGFVGQVALAPVEPGQRAERAHLGHAPALGDLDLVFLPETLDHRVGHGDVKIAATAGEEGATPEALLQQVQAARVGQGHGIGGHHAAVG